MTAADLSARAQRIRDIVEANFGKVLGRAGNTVTVEIPADVAPGLSPVWGQGGFVPIFRSQDTHLAERRVTDTQGNAVVCPGDMVTTAFYRFEIDLRLRSPGKAQPSPAAITAPTRPFGAQP